MQVLREERHRSGRVERRWIQHLEMRYTARRREDGRPTAAAPTEKSGAEREETERSTEIDGAGVTVVMWTAAATKGRVSDIGSSGGAGIWRREH